VLSGHGKVYEGGTGMKSLASGGEEHIVACHLFPDEN
jgi:hypothetical protein